MFFAYGILVFELSLVGEENVVSCHCPRWSRDWVSAQVLPPVGDRDRWAGSRARRQSLTEHGAARSCSA